ncbi:MAG: hypothetical protein FWE12_02380 [Oscillospiraceae bacterium]|nr:hypothetical protein [Oscillospiraceae bacterium]
MKKAIGAIVVVIILIILIFSLLIDGLVTGFLWINRWNAGTAYSRAIQNYLEEKYEEDFVVERRWRTQAFNIGPSLVGRPFTTHVYFYAWPAADPEHVFIVDVIRRSERSGQIGLIRDHYYRRFLREKLQEYAEVFFVDVFGEEMKIDVFFGSRLNRFPPELNHRSTLKDFFIASSREEFYWSPGPTGRPSFAMTFSVIIFLPSYEGTSESEVRESVRRFLLQIHESAPNVGASVLVYYTNNPRDFDLIDTSIDDEVRFNWYRLHGRLVAFEHSFWNRHNSTIGADTRFNRRFTEIYWNSITHILLELETPPPYTPSSTTNAITP